MNLFVLAFGKCQNSSHSPNMNYWKYEGHLMLKPKTMLFVGIFLFLMTQSWPSSQERFGSLPGSDAPVRERAGRRAAWSGPPGEHAVQLTVVWLTGQDGTDLTRACLAPHVLVPPLGLQPHRNACSCSKKLLHSSNTEQPVVFAAVTALSCSFYILVCAS